MRGSKLKLRHAMNRSGISPSAEAVGDAPDLLSEILLRIPAKPLLKFKCVSKLFLSIISDPKFCSSHTRHHSLPNPTPDALLLNNFYSLTPHFQLVPLPGHRAGTTRHVPYFDYLNVPRVKILNSCNGLLLCVSSFLLNPSDAKVKRTEISSSSRLYHVDYCSSVISSDDRGHKYFVCNPTTKRFRILPFPHHERRNSAPALCLAFDPLKSPHYKVVCVAPVDKMRRTPWQIDVYSSETDSWNLLPTPSGLPIGIKFDSGVFFNGSVHWYSSEGSGLYFDVESGSFNKMAMPCWYSWGRHVLYFGESRGHLHMVVSKDYIALNVLQMESNYSKWFVQYHLVLNHIKWPLELGWGKFVLFSVLTLIQAEKKEESMIVIFVNNTAMSFNLSDGTLNKLCDLESSPRLASIAVPAFDYEARDTFQYFESLISV